MKHLRIGILGGMLVLLCNFVKAQETEEKWRLKFDLGNESYLSSAVDNDLDALGRSSFTGFTLGVQRKIYDTRNLTFSLGLDYAQKINFFRSNGTSPIFDRGFHKGLTHHYLSIPIRIKYTKSDLIQPYFELVAGGRIGKSGQNADLKKLFRPLESSFISLGTGVEIALSKKISLSLGVYLSANELLSGGPKPWSKGFQVGVRVAF